MFTVIVPIISTFDWPKLVAASTIAVHELIIRRKVFGKELRIAGIV